MLKLVKIVEQLLGVVSNLDKPLVDRATLYWVVAAPALAIDHLFVCQNRLIGVTPVNVRLFFVGQSTLHETGKKPLLPTVVLGGAGGDFALPIKGKTQAR